MTGWLPRETIQARVQCDDLFDLSHRITEKLRKSSGWLPRKLAEEARVILAGLADELRRINLPGIDNVEVQIDEANRRISGAAILDVDGKIQLTLSLGFLLAVDEATLEFLSHDDALCPMAVLTEVPSANAPNRVHRYFYEQDERRGRYVNYELDRRGQADYITSGFPADLWRLRQQELLFALVLRWAALHEIAHGALCHVEILQAFFDPDAVGLGLTENGTKTGKQPDASAWKTLGYADAPDVAADEAAMRKVMELHADTCALWLAFDLDRAAADRGDGLFENYERDIIGLVAQPKFHFVTLANDNRVHFQLLAALITIVLFEFGRRSAGKTASDTHPSPEARLITVIREAFYGSTLARPDGDGGFMIVIPDADIFPEHQSSMWNRFVEDGPARAIEDMLFFADVLELDIVLFEADAQHEPGTPIEYYADGYLRPVRDVDQSQMSGWWQDVLGRSRMVLEHLQSGTAGYEPHSAGGRELRTLDAYHVHLNRISEFLQFQRGGKAVTFLLTMRADEEEIARKSF